VIIDQQARHPFYYAMEKTGELPSFLEKVYYSPDLLVARIRH